VQLERELADVEARLQRGLDALLSGTQAADELRARLKIEKDRKAALAAELEALKGRRADVAHLDEKRLLEELRARVRDVRGLLGQDICCRTPRRAGIWTDAGDHDVGLARGALRVTSAARRR
jgi:hypothetical protein